MSDRTFGVEIECESPWRGNYNVNSYNATLDLFRAARLPVRPGGSYGGGTGWTCHGDGSEIELDSPILSGRDGFQQLKTAYEILNSNGFRTGPYDGGHVHHGAPEFVNNNELTGKLLDSWLNNRRHIVEFVSPRRRNNYGSCPTVTPHTVESVKAGNGADRRHELNTLGVIGGGTPHGTIEFRLHEGTLDYEAIRAWIIFGQKLIDGVLNRKRPIPTCKSGEDLVNRLRVGLTAKRNLRPWRSNART